MSQYKELADRLEKFAAGCCIPDDENTPPREAAAIMRSLDAQPVAVYHGRCVIDCGENGHSDVEMLKLIPAGTKLYAAPVAAQPPEQETLALPWCKSLIAALKRLSFAAQTTGGVAGPDAELQAALAQAEEAMSLKGLVAAAQPQQAKPEPLSYAELRKIIGDSVEGVTVEESVMFRAVARAAITAFCLKNGIKEQG